MTIFKFIGIRHEHKLGWYASGNDTTTTHSLWSVTTWLANRHSESRMCHFHIVVIASKHYMWPASTIDLQVKNFVLWLVTQFNTSCKNVWLMPCHPQLFKHDQQDMTQHLLKLYDPRDTWTFMTRCTSSWHLLKDYMPISKKHEIVFF